MSKCGSFFNSRYQGHRLSLLVIAGIFPIDQTRSQKGFSYAMEGEVSRPGLCPAGSRSDQDTLGLSIQGAECPVPNCAQAGKHLKTCQAPKDLPSCRSARFYFTLSYVPYYLLTLNRLGG